MCREWCHKPETSLVGHACGLFLMGVSPSQKLRYVPGRDAFGSWRTFAIRSAQVPWSISSATARDSFSSARTRDSLRTP